MADDTTTEEASVSLLKAFISGMVPAYAETAHALIEQGVEVPVAWGVATGVRDFISCTGLRSAGEEHRTSTLMGFLATSMGVFHRLARLSGYECVPRILWHQARKQSSHAHGDGEDKIGGDFGIAVPLEGGQVRISFFQAKNIVRSGQLDVGGAVKPPKGVGVERLDFRADADSRLIDWAVNGQIDTAQYRTDDHQIIKLARTQMKGRDSAANQKESASINWVHFIAWSENEPMLLELDYCRRRTQNLTVSSAQVRVEIINAVTRLKFTDQDCKKFSEHLALGLCRTAKGWLELPIADAKKIVGELVDLGSGWYVIDDSTGAGAQQLLGRTCVSVETAASSAKLPDAGIEDYRPERSMAPKVGN